MIESYFDENLVINNLDVNSKEEALEYLSKILINNNIVKKEYLSKILEREVEYPTGLELGNINVAIPHTDSVYVNKGKILFAVLKNPIKFKKMDNPDVDIEVSIILMLAVSEPKAQIEILQKIFSFIQNQKLLLDIIKIKDKTKLVEILRKEID